MEFTGKIPLHVCGEVLHYEDYEDYEEGLATCMSL